MTPSSLSILAATDLSAPSRHAAQRAALLAKQPGGSLALVYVLEKNALTDLRRLLGDQCEVIETRIRSQAQEALAQMAADIQQSQGVCADYQVVDGSELETIIAQAKRLNANLLVVGARGAGFMRHWLLGATAERLLRKNPDPILVVKQAPHAPYWSVLVPVDFSQCSLGAIHLARSLACNAQLILLHACEVPFEGKMRFAGVKESTIRAHRETMRREALIRIQQFAADAGLDPTHWRPVVTHGDPAQCIAEQEEEQGADLIVMGKNGTGVTEELLLGSVTKHVLGQARADVLVTTR